MPSTTRGPLPAHIYKRRRLVLITVAVLLVLGFGRLLGGSSDGSEAEADQATPVVANATPSAQTTKKKNKKNKDGKGKGDQGTKTPTATPTPTPTPTPPAEPSGPCPDADVLITPAVPQPVAGSDVTIVLNMQMGTTEACTWRVSSQSVTVKIYAGADDVWSTRECPATVPTQDVVLRRELATPVSIVWSSKRSDEYCTGRTAWALPGTYGVSAAAFEGEPTDVTFELTTPAAVVITQTAAPTQQPDQSFSAPNG